MSDPAASFDPEKFTFDPHELLLQFGRLRELVTPLVALAEIDRALLPHIVELAMTLGIVAQQRAQARTDAWDTLAGRPCLFPLRAFGVSVPLDPR